MSVGPGSVMWTRIVGVLCAGVLFSGASCGGNTGLESPRPLARVQVKLTEPQQRQLFNILMEFSDRAHFKLEGGAFSRTGRPFHLITIHIDGQTDFQVTNFRIPNIFELNVYSRADEEAWRPYWSELISDLSSSFGPDRISATE